MGSGLVAENRGKYKYWFRLWEMVQSKVIKEARQIGDRNSGSQGSTLMLLADTFRQE